MKANHDIENEKDQFDRITKKLDLYYELKKYPTERAWEKVQDRIHKKSSKTKFRRLFTMPLMRIAAAILVTSMLSVVGYEIYSNRLSASQLIVVSDSNQQVKTVELPDGTLVSLNSGTKLKYPEKFSGNIREVSIEGEAFFEVKPNKAKPFIIHAGNAQIKVLGTSFNVCAYSNTKSVEIIVQTGKVQVTDNTVEAKPDSELILTPGEKGTVVFSGNKLLKTTNQDPNFLAWKTHDLIFKATKLEDVIRNLEKVYKVKISLNDQKLNSLLLTAHFNDYSLDFILNVIGNTLQLESHLSDGQYIIKAKS